MSSQNIMVVAVIAAVAIAVVALLVALLAVRRLRQLSSPQRSSGVTWSETTPRVQPSHATRGTESGTEVGNEIAISDQSPRVPTALQARVVEGRVVMTPTSRQIVDATMGRPIVKASILVHGLAHALRPESRDRIRALMRREYNRSRNQRRRAARQAARTATTNTQMTNPGTADAATPGRHAAAVDAHAWLGELPPRRDAPGELEVNR